MKYIADINASPQTDFLIVCYRYYMTFSRIQKRIPLLGLVIVRILKSLPNGKARPYGDWIRQLLFAI